MDITVLDFETYSESNLKKVGLSRYAMDESTELICMSYSIDGGTVKSWIPGQMFPLDLQNALRNRPEMWAWNSAFEIQIWRHVGIRMGMPPCPPLEQWRCSMALSCYFGLPAALAIASRVVGVSEKSNTGINLIRLLSIPCKWSKKFPHTRRTPETHPDLFKEFYVYCDDDVRAESSVRNVLPRQQLPAQEQLIWLQNMEANLRGVKVDMDLVGGLKEIRDTHFDALSKEFVGLCGLEPTQTIAFRAYLLDEFLLNMPNLQKQTIEDTLKDEELDPTARRLLEIRASASQVAGKKLDAIERTGDFDGRIRDMLFYYGAGTGRFAGRQVQLQNLARGAFKVSENDPRIINGLTPDDVIMLYGYDPMRVVGTMIRPCITCDDDKFMYDADFASIEARVLAWYAGQDDLVRLFQQGQDAYKHMAGDIFNKAPGYIDDDERFFGKTAVLGAGFQCGWRRFQEMCDGYGVEVSDEMAQHVISTYREKNHKIKQSWYETQDAFMTAIRNPNRLVRINQVVVSSNGKYLFAKLPSGRTITYVMPSIVAVKKDFKDGKGPQRILQIQYYGIDSLTRKWGKQQTYGGKLVENLVQGMARDLMCYSMNTVIERGFDLLFHVHDQIICQYPNGNVLDEYIRLMSKTPAWARGIPVAAEGKVCKRFSK